jgi:predicted RNA polymerase sigma factor
MRPPIKGSSIVSSITPRPPAGRESRWRAASRSPAHARPRGEHRVERAEHRAHGHDAPTVMPMMRRILVICSLCLAKKSSVVLALTLSCGLRFERVAEALMAAALSSLTVAELRPLPRGRCR